jgi:hypothetical protein
MDAFGISYMDLTNHVLRLHSYTEGSVWVDEGIDLELHVQIWKYSRKKICLQDTVMWNHTKKSIEF